MDTFAHLGIAVLVMIAMAPFLIPAYLREKNQPLNFDRSFVKIPPPPAKPTETNDKKPFSCPEITNGEWVRVDDWKLKRDVSKKYYYIGYTTTIGCTETKYGYQAPYSMTLVPKDEY